MSETRILDSGFSHLELPARPRWSLRTPARWLGGLLGAALALGLGWAIGEPPARAFRGELSGDHGVRDLAVELTSEGAPLFAYRDRSGEEKQLPLHPGQEIVWQPPGGGERRLRVVSLESQGDALTLVTESAFHHEAGGVIDPHAVTETLHLARTKAGLEARLQRRADPLPGSPGAPVVTRYHGLLAPIR